jgi:A-kinase anchor protein 13
VPKGTDSIEEAASRIVEAVIERVKASGALTTEGEMRHVLSSSPRLGPQMEQQVNASADGVSALPPEDTLQMDGTHEGTTQNLEGCFVGKEETEKIFLPVQGPEPAIGKQSKTQN